MIQAKELRIGNLVQEDNNNLIGKVNELRQDFGDEPYDVVLEVEDVMFLEVQIEDIKPIPLTEEWLVKFGFEKSVDNYYKRGVCMSLEEWGDEKGNEGIGYFYMLRDEGIMDMHIKHTHQLQNLYFALTGKELTIKQ